MKKKRILVVDDDGGITSLVKKALDQTGLYEVREELLAERCLAAAHEFLPDLILLDWNMPILNGAEVAQQLSRDGDLWNVPILFITGFGARAGKLGHPVLEKPFSAQELARWVGILVAKGERASEKA